MGNEALTPQPGAVTRQMLNLSLPKIADFTVDGFPPLPAKEAANFATGAPPLKTLPAGWSFYGDPAKFTRGVQPVVIDLSSADYQKQPLCRVWGEPAWDIGSYWTLSAPASEDDFYGKDAVQYSWNSARYVARLNNGGAISSIKAWIGYAGPQVALGLDGSGKPAGVMPDYFLPGGAVQVYIPQNTLPWVAVSAPPWRSASASQPAAPAPPAAQPLSAAELPPGVDAAGYAQLSVAVSALSALLKGLTASHAAGTLESQALILERTMQWLNADLVKTAADAEARVRARLVAESLRNIGRLVDSSFAAGDPAAVDRQVTQVVLAAHHLAASI